MLRDIRMHNNELSITSMLNYLVSSSPHNYIYSEYINRLPTKLLNYVTPIVNKKNEIDTIKIEIETESANGAAVSITYFWRFYIFI